MVFGIFSLIVVVRSSPLNSLGQYYYDYSENVSLIDPNSTPVDPYPNMTELVQPRRFKDLDKMIKEINPDFDSRKYWAYGCHCFALNDRPSSSMGRGKPVDELDTLCKKYKECQKCAQKRFGEVKNNHLKIDTKMYFRNVSLSWFLITGHVLVQIKIKSNVRTVRTHVRVPHANVTNCSQNDFCSPRPVSSENTICFGQEEHQKVNLTLKEDANQAVTQMQQIIGPVAAIQMAMQHFSMQKNKSVAKILL